MVATGRNCQEIMVQIASVRAALEQVSLKLAELHLKVCFANLTTRPDSSQPEQVIELIRLIGKH
jgi:DNA-binding FrmR family transcriptional regulator